MTYGHSTRAFIENGPSELVAKAASSRSTARSWQMLTEACRVTLVEQALRAANQRVGGYPAAL